MKTYTKVKEVVNKPVSIICDVCDTEYFYDIDILETQEFLSFQNYCGYGSVFGDGSCYTLDICQHCIKELFEDKIKIS